MFIIWTKLWRPSVLFTLVYFREMKILILSPHIDDAFLSLGGVIAKFAPRHDLEVINIFSYDPWVLEKSDTRNKLKNISIRKAEERRNSMISRVKVKFLDYPAGWKERGYPKWQMNFSRKRDNEIICELSEKLINLSKKCDLVFSPLGIGGHVDHRLVRYVAAEHLDKSKIFYYEDLPYAIEGSFFRYAKDFQESQQLLNYTFNLNKVNFRKKEIFVNNYKSQLTKGEIKLVMEYTLGNLKHKVSRSCSEIVWTYRDNFRIIRIP